MTKLNRKVLVVGNIGSGKSTVVTSLAKHYEVPPMLEDLSDDGFGKELKAHFENPSNKTVNDLGDAVHKNIRKRYEAEKISIMEREFESLRVFSDYYYLKGFDTNYFPKDFNHIDDIIIYIRASEDVQRKRIKERGTIENINMPDLRLLNYLHDKRFSEKLPNPIYWINGDNNKNKVLSDCIFVIDNIGN